MYLKKGTTVIVLSLVIACFSVVDALTVPLPPATTQVVVAAATGKAYLPASSSAILPSQRKLLEKTTTFNLAAATATTTATAAQGTTAATPTSSTTKPATVASSSTTKGDSSSSSTGVSITGLNFDGKIPTTEADEYIVISNRSKSPIDVSGYYVYVATTGTQGPTFTFPKGSTIKPDTSVRIYTNEIHKETGGYSFGSGKAIWNNKGGLAVLKDSTGKKLGEFKYKPTS